MNLPATIFLCVISLFIGAAIGSMIEKALKKRPVAPPPLPASDSKLAQDGDAEVFSAFRSAANQVWLNMDGKRLNSKEELSPEQRRRLLGLVVDLRPWLETAQPISRDPVPGLESAKPQEMKTQLPAEPVASPPAMESIIQQIDKVLQEKLETSQFNERGIQLTEGPGGIVIIKDGANRYEGVEAVPDPQIKSLIQQAVSEWEKSTK